MSFNRVGVKFIVLSLMVMSALPAFANSIEGSDTLSAEMRTLEKKAKIEELRLRISTAKAAKKDLDDGIRNKPATSGVGPGGMMNPSVPNGVSMPVRVQRKAAPPTVMRIMTRKGVTYAILHYEDGGTLSVMEGDSIPNGQVLAVGVDGVVAKVGKKTRKLAFSPRYASFSPNPEAGSGEAGQGTVTQQPEYPTADATAFMPGPGM